MNTANTVITEAVKYYFTGSDLPTAPALLGVKSSCNAQCIHDAVDAWLTHVPEDYDALWMVSIRSIYTILASRSSLHILHPGQRPGTCESSLAVMKGPSTS